MKRFRGSLIWILAAIAIAAVPAFAGNYSVQQILNKVFIDENGNALNAVMSEQAALNAVLSESGSALRIYIEGGAGSSTLSELMDTTISSPTNGQTLTYDSGTSKWVNSASSADIKALRSGLAISRSDNTHIVVGPGTVAIAGALYSVPVGGLTVDCATVQGSYTTWNPSDKFSSISLSNGNLTAAASGWGVVRGFYGKTTGKHYFEITIDARSTSIYLGVATESADLSQYLGADSYGWSYGNGTAAYKANNGVTSWGSALFGATDILSVAVDLDSGKIWIAVNGVWQGSGDPANGSSPMFSNLSGTIYPAFSTNGGTGTANFGASSFSYSVPSGFNSGWYNESLSANTKYFVYAKAPGSGTALSTDEVTISADQPNTDPNSNYGYLDHSTHGRWIGTIETDASGYIIDPILVPNQAVQYGTDGTMALGVKARIDAKTLTTAGFDVEVRDSNKTYVLTIAGLTDNRAAVLPAATGSGADVGFFLVDGDATYDLRVDPDGTDQIVTTSAAGDYLGADAAGAYLRLVDIASGKWGIVEKQGTWTEE